MSKEEFDGKDERVNGGDVSHTPDKPLPSEGKTAGGKKDAKRYQRRFPRSKGDINFVTTYFRSEELKRQLASFSFNSFNGRPEVFDGTFGETEILVPNMMQIKINPSCGFTGMSMEEQTTAGINQAAKKLFTQLSARNSKGTLYQPCDVACALLMVGSIIEMASFGARALGAFWNFGTRNRLVPTRLLSLLGIDYDDLDLNYRNYKNEYDALMVVANGIKVLSDVPYFDKCSKIYANYYVDQPDSAMAQLYAFVPHSTWILDEETYETGTCMKELEVIPMNKTHIKFSEYLSKLRTMIGAALNSTTLDRVYSDVLAYHQRNNAKLYEFAKLPETYMITATYSPEVSLYINNATFNYTPLTSDMFDDFGIENWIDDPDTGYTSGNDVFCDPNKMTVVYRPVFNTNDDFGTRSAYCNWRYDNPGDEDRIYATAMSARHKSHWIANSATGRHNNISYESALPDHYVVGIRIIKDTNPDNDIYFHYNVRYTSNEHPDTTMEREIAITSALAKFDWHPYLYYMKATYENVAGEDEDPIWDVVDADALAVAGDLQYWTLLDFKYMKPLYDTEMLTLFSIA